MKNIFSELDIFHRLIEDGMSIGRCNATLDALRIMGLCGCAVWREISDAITTIFEPPLDRGEIGPGLARRAVNDLVRLGWVEKATPKLYRNMTLTLVRLTDTGWKAADEVLMVEDWPILHPERSEWDMVQQDHRGGGEAHTVGLLALAWQGRRRGWNVRLCPKQVTWVDRILPCEPDAVVWKLNGGKMTSIRFVEFETQARGKIDKWLKYDQDVPLLVAALTHRRAISLAREIDATGGEMDVYITSLEELLQDGERSKPLMTYPYDLLVNGSV